MWRTFLACWAAVAAFGFAHADDATELPDGAAARLGSTFLRNAGNFPAFLLACTIDGRIVSGDERAISIWDGKDSSLLLRVTNDAVNPRTHRAGLRCAAVSADGSTIAAGCHDGTVRVWDARSGRERHVFESEWMTSLTFSPDGNRLVAGCVRGNLRSWDLSTGEMQGPRKFGIPCVNSLVWPTDPGPIFAACGVRSFRLYAVNSDLEPYSLHESLGSLSEDAIALAAEGKSLAISNKTDIHLWNLAENKWFPRLSQPHSPWAFALSAATDEIALVSGERVLVRKMSAKKPRLEPPIQRPSRITYSADGSRLYCVIGTAIWEFDLSTSEATTTPGILGPVRSIGLARHTALVLVADWQGRMTMWNAFDKSLQFEAEQPRVDPLSLPPVPEIEAQFMTFAPSGKKWAAGGGNTFDGAIRQWDAQSGRIVTEARLDAWEAWKIQKVCYSPDGTRIGAADTAFRTLLCRSEGGIPEEVRKISTNKADAIGFTADNLSLNVWTDDQDTASKRDRTSVRHFTLPLDRPIRLRRLSIFADDGKSVAVADRSHAQLWSVEERRLIGTVEGPFSNYAVDEGEEWLLCLAIGRDDRLATGGADGSVRLWDARNGKLRQVFRGHRGAVHALAFSRDGRWLVSGSDDATVLTWPILSEPRDAPPPEVEFNRDELSQLWSELDSDVPAEIDSAVRQLAAGGEGSMAFIVEQLSASPPKTRASDDGPRSISLKAQRAIYVLHQMDSPKSRDALRVIAKGASLESTRSAARGAVDWLDRQRGSQ